MTSGSRDNERRECDRCGHLLRQHHHQRPVDCSGCNAGGEHCEGPAATPPVEGEMEPTAMCTACGQWHPLLALLYARCDASGDGQHHVDGRYPPTPPVVSDQPEETDTVNEAWRERATAVVEGAWPDARDDPKTSAAEWSIGVVRELCEIASELLSQPSSPAVGAEVRVEWGVRWSDQSGSARQWFGDRAERDEFVSRLREWGFDIDALGEQTISWQPVTDEETDRA